MQVDFSRDYFYKLRDLKPTSDMAKFHQFIYLNAFAFGKKAEAGTAPNAFAGCSIRDRLEHLPRVSERLSKVKISNSDFRILINTHNQSDSFFYLDPPYPEQQGKLSQHYMT